MRIHLIGGIFIFSNYTHITIINADINNLTENEKFSVKRMFSYS